MLTGDLRVFGGNANMAPPCRVVLFAEILLLGDHHAAIANSQIQRRINLRVVEFQQHVLPGNTELGRAKGDKRRDVERPDPQYRQIGNIGREFQLALVLVLKRCFGLYPGPAEHRQKFLQNSPLGHRDAQGFIRRRHQNLLLAVKPGSARRTFIEIVFRPPQGRPRFAKIFRVAKNTLNVQADRRATGKNEVYILVRCLEGQ